MKRLRYDIIEGFDKGVIDAYENDNNTEIYNIKMMKDRFRNVYDLSGKGVILCIIDPKTKGGDVLEIEIVEAAEGVIKLPIKSELTLKDGVYIAQFTIHADNFRQSTKVFTINIKNSILNEISGEIVENEKFKFLIDALDRVDSYTSMIKEIKNKADENSTRIDSNNSLILENTTKISEIEGQITSEVSRVEAVLNETKEIVDNSVDKITGIKEEIEDLKQNQPGLGGITEKVNTNTEEIKVNTRELDGLRGEFETPEERLMHEINKVALNKDNSGFIKNEGYIIDSKGSLGGYSRDCSIYGETFQNVIDVIGEWENQTTYAYIEVSHSRLKPNTKYTLYIPNLSSKIEKINFGAYAETRYLPDTHAKIAQFTTPSVIFNKDTYVRILAYSGKTLDESDFKDKKILIVEGSLEYVPEYFEKISSPGAEENKLKFKSLNKNLFPLDVSIEVENQATHRINEDLIEITPVNQPTGESYIITESIRLEPDKTYAVSFHPEPDSDFKKGEVLNGDTNEVLSNTFTTDKRYFDIKIALYVTNDSRERVGRVRVQIEENQTATIYEKPYISHKIINLPFEGGLKSVPSSRDYIKGEFIFQNVGYYTATNESNWVIYQELTNCVVFNLRNTLFLSSGVGNSISNRFNYIHTWDDVEHFHINDLGGLYITISKEKISGNSLENFLSWLRDNPIEIIYKLKTPKKYQLEEEFAFETFNEYTKITTGNKTNPLMEMSIPTKINELIGVFAKENKTLKNNNSLLKQSIKTIVDSVILILNGETFENKEDYISENIKRVEEILKEIK